MKKVKEKDLVIGDEYYLSHKKESRGIFVGFDFKGAPMFYPTFNTNYRVSDEPNGTIGFPSCDYEYDEVE